MSPALDLLRAGQRGRFDFEPSFGIDDLDTVIEAGLRWPTFRLVRDGDHAVPSEICKPAFSWGVTTVDDAADPAAISRHLGEGWTLVLDQLHRQHGPSALLNRGFEIALSARSRVDVTVVPDGGVAPTPETLDNVLLGLHGCSVFEVGGEVVRLREGEGLVVPREEIGTLPAEGLSAYAIVAIARVTWREVLLEAFEAFDARLTHDEARIEPHGPKTLSAAEQDTWEQVVGLVTSELDAEDALNRIATRIVKSRLPYLPGSLQGGQVEIDADTWVARRPEVMYRIHEDDRGVHLVFNSSEITVIHKARFVLEFIAESPAFNPGQIPGIPENQRVGFAKTLLDAGFLALRQ